MGKDKKGVFHPPKGKPSGSLNEDTSIPADIKDAHVMHPNRNVNKDEGDYIEKPAKAGYQSSQRKQRLSPKAGTAVEPEMLTEFNEEKFRELAAVCEEVCISIYMPTHNAGVEVNE